MPENEVFAAADAVLARAETLSQQLADASRGNAGATSGQRPRKRAPAQKQLSNHDRG